MGDYCRFAEGVGTRVLFASLTPYVLKTTHIDQLLRVKVGRDNYCRFPEGVATRVSFALLTP